MSNNTIYEGKEFMKRRVIATIYPSKTYPPILVKFLSEKNNKDITAIAEYVYATLRGVEKSRDINNDDFLKAMDKAFQEYGINKESLTRFTQTELENWSIQRTTNINAKFKQLDSQEEDVQTHKPRR